MNKENNILEENYYQIKSIIENSKSTFNNSNYSADGRINSTFDEGLIISHLQTLFPQQIEIAPPRYWYDICLSYKENNYYINIKSTSGEHADNISSKKGLYYALTGRIPEKINSYQKYNENLIRNYNPNSSSDYYFVVFFKKDHTFLFTSLKHLNNVVPNGNNLPFQCLWGQEKDNIFHRSSVEQSKYLLNAYIDSYIKKSAGLDTLLDWRVKNDDETRTAGTIFHA